MAVARPLPPHADDADGGWAARLLGAAPDGQLVRLFDVEPDLLDGLDPDLADELRLRGIARRAVIEPGAWTPPRPVPARRAESLGFLVLEGFLVRSLDVCGRDCPELLGPGDLIRPWDAGEQIYGVDEGAAWRVLARASVAVLEGRFARTVCPHPAVVSQLLSRAVARSRALALQLGIAHVRQAETRLLLALWHLADRWGRVTPDGVHLPIPLTHETLAHLVCMRRPTASTALTQLTRDGRIARHVDGGWVLLGAAPDPLGAASC